jgi:ribosomal protein S12 methylthiotransferase
LRPSKTIAFVTLGCAKNEVDSDKMRARVRAAGYRETTDLARADAIIVNTCSFITEATEESLATILELLELPHLASGAAPLVVTGCMPSRYGDELTSGLPEVAAFASCAEENRIVEILDALLLKTPSDGEDDGQDDGEDVRDAPRLEDGPSGGLALGGGLVLEGGLAPESGLALADSSARQPTRTVSAPWAYVKIADGCDRRCSFCTIPNIKGRYRSVPADEIVAEVAELVDGGVREVVLIAQDTGLWGRDFPRDGAPGGAPGRTSSPNTPTDLAGLLSLLAESFPSTWLRVMYLQPQGITDELLAVMARHANICRYLDIPLQHASARVLREMNRRGSAADYLELLARIRGALPDVALRTTVIAGFPGETRFDARELERFIEAAAFDYVGVFVYSQEEGTVAAARDDQVPVRTRRARAQRLRDCADAIGFAKAAERVGMVEEVLVVEAEEMGEDVAPPVADESEGPLGRTQRQAPEVDGMVHLDQGDIGALLSVTIEESYCYELSGKVVALADV